MQFFLLLVIGFQKRKVIFELIWISFQYLTYSIAISNCNFLLLFLTHFESPIVVTCIWHYSNVLGVAKNVLTGRSSEPCVRMLLKKHQTCSWLQVPHDDLCAITSMFMPFLVFYWKIHIILTMMNTFESLFYYLCPEILSSSLMKSAP